MTIYTKHLGATTYRGARIKVWMYWAEGDRMERVFSYPYDMGDRAHEACVQQFLHEWKDLVFKHFAGHTITQYLLDPPTGPWYMGESESGKGHVFINSISVGVTS